jgi:hypothetical protein
MTIAHCCLNEMSMVIDDHNLTITPTYDWSSLAPLKRKESKNVEQNVK